MVLQIMHHKVAQIKTYKLMLLQVMHHKVAQIRSMLESTIASSKWRKNEHMNVLHHQVVQK